ncbi:hypothetical protein [Nocardia aurantia]|uniref:Uncharacterized protein n=1 Tax=Nocardia aurantia TaxID=2585199 RepID=A0A7K0DWS7_9NOCA|nr:hypothetical protein [Nocardia aurantia]MQY30226.1 hypothetical protein [Nocardia aurantia]
MRRSFSCPFWLSGPVARHRRPARTGDRGDGTVARARVEDLLRPEAHGTTFELYDGPVMPEWYAAFTALTVDRSRCRTAFQGPDSVVVVTPRIRSAVCRADSILN